MFHNLVTHSVGKKSLYSSTDCVKDKVDFSAKKDCCKIPQCSTV